MLSVAARWNACRTASQPASPGRPRRSRCLHRRRVRQAGQLHAQYRFRACCDTTYTRLLVSEGVSVRLIQVVSRFMLSSQRASVPGSRGPSDGLDAGQLDALDLLLEVVPGLGHAAVAALEDGQLLVDLLELAGGAGGLGQLADVGLAQAL